MTRVLGSNKDVVLTRNHDFESVKYSTKEKEKPALTDRDWNKKQTTRNWAATEHSAIRLKISQQSKEKFFPVLTMKIFFFFLPRKNFGLCIQIYYFENFTLIGQWTFANKHNIKKETRRNRWKNLSSELTPAVLFGKKKVFNIMSLFWQTLHI